VSQVYSFFKNEVNFYQQIRIRTCWWCND